MDIETNILLIQTILKNDILFAELNDVENFKIVKCEDYDDMNLYKCSKNLDSTIDSKKYLDNLSKINIRETLFDSYVKIKKIKDIDNTSWIEKTIYNEKDYNIQNIHKGENYIKCYSDITLDDNTFEYNWVNNPFTLIQVDDNIKLFIAFEVSNLNQNELLERFLSCLNKLEHALK
jgi:hypothetical protein